MAYKFIASNDDKDFCSCCGKQGLKRVVWLEHTETTEISHYGTHCAALLMMPAKAKTAGDKSRIVEQAAMKALEQIRNSFLEKNNASSYWKTVYATGKDLIAAGVEKDFGFVSGKTDVFCNYVWPYQNFCKRANELGVTEEEYFKLKHGK